VLIALMAVAATRSMGAGMDAAPWAERTPPIFHLVASQTNRDVGLPYTSTTTALAKDDSGFLWIGTQSGLERWDGYSIRRYDGRQAKRCAFQPGFIGTLYVDDARQLWIGTLSGVLARYDPQTDCVVQVAGSGNSFTGSTIESIRGDGAGGLWLGTGSGLVHVAPDHTQLTRVDIDPGDGADWTHTRVPRVLRDRRGDLWIGTDHGLARRTRSGGTFVAVPLAPGVKVRELFESSDGRIWVGTVANGAFVVDPSTLSVRGVEQILRQKPVPLIFGAAEAPGGQIWLSTPSAGIIIVDPVSLQTQVLHHQKGVPTTLDDNGVNSLLVDGRGLLWAATDSGFGYFDTEAAVSTIALGEESSGLPEGGADGIAAMSDGRLAIAVGGQIHLISPQGRDTERVPLDLPVALASLASIVTPDGRDLFGDVQPVGLVWIDRHAGRAHPIPLPGPGESRHVLATVAEGDRIWVGCIEGVWSVERRQDAADGSLPWVATRRYDVRNVIAIAPGPKGIHWIGTTAGLLRADAGSAETTPVQFREDPADRVAGPFVTTVLTDRHGRLWVGTNSEGVFVLDMTTDPGNRARVLRHFDAELPASTVAQLLQDDSGDVWVGTDRGLVRIDPETFVSRLIGRGDGAAISAYALAAALRTSSGDLMFGGQGGITLVRPRWHPPTVAPPPVVITRIAVGHREVPSARFNVDAGAQELAIPADATSLMVEFAALDYSDPSSNRYAYRLDGYDKDWVQAGADSRMAMYANLAPGTYRLHLRGTDHAGVWSPQERELTVRVAAAWYQTMWFHGLELLAGLLAVMLVVQSRTVLLRVRQRELESLVEDRTQALVRATGERNALIENLAHDLRTPLTSLRGCLERLNLDDETLMAADRGRFIGIAVRQADRLIRLVHELFELVRLDDPLAKLSLERFSPAEIVQDVVQEFASIADGRTVVCEIDPGLESAQIVGDISLFQRMIDNLVVNALSHTPSGGRIAVRLGSEEAGIVLSVSDTGRGIERTDLERIFNRYERGDTTGRISGAGLGLAIVKRILELHRGSIAVDSEVGRGTRFTVRLPWSGPVTPVAAAT
jgi:signal transduction histidine kinase/ligand-binding sensor domain-containing protein